MAFVSNPQPASPAGPSTPEPSRPWFDDQDVRHRVRGNFRPVSEEVSEDDLPVEGSLPSQLDGLFLRNGPNPQYKPRGTYHPFDGDGMVHAVRLRDGKASYRNRWVESRQLKYERTQGRAIFYGMNEGFQFPEPEHIARAGATKNVANINIVGHSGRLLAVSENGGPIELDYDLNTRGPARFGGEKLLRYTGHPHRVPDTDELVGFAYSPFAPFMRYILVDPDGTIVINDIVDIPDPVMIHDICICGDYVVFLDAPAILDLSGGQNGKEFLSWKPERGCRFGVLPLRGRGWEVRWFDVDPCYIYHYFNGWQQGDELVFVAEWFPQASVEFPDEQDSDQQVFSGVPVRFTLDLKTGRTRQEQLADQWIALPVVDQERFGQPTRHGYAVGFDEQEMDHWNQIVRLDLHTGELEKLHVGQGRCVSEPAYVPDPNDPREGQGFLLHYVTDLSSMTSELWVLSARDIQAGPIAKLKLPQRVPHGFHGSWLPSTDMGTLLRSG